MEHLEGGGTPDDGFVDAKQIWPVRSSDHVRVFCEWLDFGIAPVMHEVSAAEIVALLTSPPSAQ